MDRTATVFANSTPAPNFDGSVPKPWRCAFAEGLQALLDQTTTAPMWVAYRDTYRGCAALVAGFRNLYGQDRTLEVQRVAEALRAQGLRVKITKNDLPELLYVYDNRKKYDPGPPCPEKMTSGA